MLARFVIADMSTDAPWVAPCKLGKAFLQRSFAGRDKRELHARMPLGHVRQPLEHDVGHLLRSEAAREGDERCGCVQREPRSGGR